MQKPPKACVPEAPDVVQPDGTPSPKEEINCVLAPNPKYYVTSLARSPRPSHYITDALYALAS